MPGWLTPLRLALGVLLAVVVLLVAGYLLDPFGWRKNRIENLTAERDAAEDSSELATGTTQAIVQYHTKETIIREASEPIIQTIKETPGADDPLPDDLRAGLIAGIHSLRDQAPAPVDDQRPRTVRRELPAPGP